MEYDTMSPLQKAAVALVAFGPEVSALVLKGMNESDLESFRAVVKEVLRIEE